METHKGLAEQHKLLEGGGMLIKGRSSRRGRKNAAIARPAGAKSQRCPQLTRILNSRRGLREDNKRKGGKNINRQGEKLAQV